MKTKLRTGFLYSLSVITGVIGTGLTLNLELNDSQEDSLLSRRALYSFLLFTSGLLFEAAKLSTADAVPKTTPSEPLSPDTHEEKLPETPEHKISKTLVSSDESTAIGLAELTSVHPAGDEKTEKAESMNEALRVDSLSSSVSGNALPIKSVRVEPQRQPYFTFLRDLMPGALFAQSLTLFLQNALAESAIAQILPYTTLAGLATGYLFRISIKPWRLWGIRRWIENHRNEFVFLEIQNYVAMLSFKLIKPYFLFSTMTASFWSGYNIEELITQIISKLLKHLPTSAKKNIPQEFSAAKQIIFSPHWSIVLVTFSSGAALTGLSFLVKQATVETDQAAVRNDVARWMVSIGNYAVTYYLGFYLGHYLPRRYYRKALIAATYLLVPFASPELSIPHFILLTGAGLCGGVAHFITKDRYLNQLSEMQQKKQLTDALLLDAKSFLQVLPQLSLGDDLLLIQHQIKKKKMTLVIKLFIIANVFVSLYLVIDRTIKNQPLIRIITALPSLLSSVLVYIGGFYLLPRRVPSVYELMPLPWLKHFFYRDSFSFTYLFKIGLILTIKANLLFFIDSKPYPGILLLDTALTIPIIIFIFTKILLKREQGYQPYIPDTQEIEQLASELKPETLRQRLASSEKRISCSYHLLKFMQQNAPISSIIPEIKASESKEVLVDSQEDHDQLSWSPCLNMRLSKSRITVLGAISAVPVATLRAGNTQLTLETEFNRPYDQLFTRQRLNTDFVMRAFDAAIRGSIVAGQFSIGMPEVLSLTSTITSFRF